MNAATSLDADTLVAVEQLEAAVRRRFGPQARISNVTPTTVGGSNRTLLFDLHEQAAARRLVLRQETISAEYTPFLPASRQYPVLRVAFEHGLPVPEPVFMLEPADGMGDGYVVGAIRGESLPKTLLTAASFASARARFLEQAGACLARLHAIDIREPALDGLRDVRESGDPLAAWTHYYDLWEEPHPVIEYALRWLDINRPQSAGKVLVHGDFRLGNMLVATEGLRALLDWECAHFGDALEDLGWFCTRSWRLHRTDRPAGGLGQRAALYHAYERAGGAPVDPQAARWWEIFGLMRWALYNLMQIFGHQSGRRRSPAFAACGRNTSLIEYDLLMTISGHYD